MALPAVPPTPPAATASVLPSTASVRPATASVQPATASLEPASASAVILRAPRPAPEPWTWSGNRSELSAAFAPFAFRPARIQFLYSLFNLPTPISGNLGNDLWLRVGDWGLRFDEEGSEVSLGYPNTIFHAWRVMVGHHGSLGGLPWVGGRLAPWLAPDDQAFLYGGLARGSNYWEDLGGNSQLTSDAGLGLAFLTGAVWTRGDWTYRALFDDLGFINWAEAGPPDAVNVGAAPHTQHLTPHLTLGETWAVGRWSLTHREVLTPVSLAYDAIGTYQLAGWFVPRLSVGANSFGELSWGGGGALYLGSYLLNVGFTASGASATPLMIGVETGASW